MKTSEWLEAGPLLYMTDIWEAGAGKWTDLEEQEIDIYRTTGIKQ